VILSIPNNIEKIMEIVTKTKLIINFNMELTQANYVKTFRANYISNIFNGILKLVSVRIGKSKFSSI